MNGLVLVIDDEGSVREAVSDILDMIGVAVITAENGREGLAQFQKYQQQIKLIMLDMQMPIMNGEETFKAIRQIDPNVKILFSSGYSESQTLKQFNDFQATTFLQKPYDLDTLITKVEKELNEP